MGTPYEKEDSSRQNLKSSEATLRKKAKEAAQCLGITQRLQKIIEAEVWPPHRSVEELNETIPKIRQKAQEFMDTLRPLKPEGHPYPWDEAYGAAIVSIALVPIYSMDPICDGDREYPLGSPDFDAWAYATGAAVDAVSYETLAEKPAESNPFLALFGIYELGALMVNFYLVDGQEKLVIDFPLGGKYKEEVACLVFGDNELGDQEVCYIHKPWETCDKNRLIGHFRREIVIWPLLDESE